MMTDKEMLELAAKAAGIDCLIWHDHANAYWIQYGERCYWNPLEDDGDALRLAVKLGLCITPYPIYNETDRHTVVVKQRRKTDLIREINHTEVYESYGENPCAATRLAIVRAAALIGAQM